MREQICECKHKEQCHIPRQYVQKLIREKNTHKTVEDCDFYKLIQELQAKRGFEWNGHEVEGYKRVIEREQYGECESDVYYLEVPTTEGVKRYRVGDWVPLPASDSTAHVQADTDSLPFEPSKDEMSDYRPFEGAYEE